MGSIPANPTEEHPGKGTRRVKVMLPLPLGGGYDYRLPAGRCAGPGDFVRVPLGKRQMIGVVWGEGDGEIEESRLRDVAQRLDAEPLPEVARRFVDWVAAYTLQPAGAVLKMCMSVPDALEPEAPRTAYRLGGEAPKRLTPARQKVIELLAEGPARTAADIAREAGVSASVVAGLAEAGTLIPQALPTDLPLAEPDLARAGPDLSPDQAKAAAELVRRAGEGGFSATLLEGVTGSGKTEVYFEAVEAALRAGRQVLVLLPEIALSAQWLERFEARFGSPPAEWHSDLGQATRRRTWRAVAEGKAKVVVGARSALFLPFCDLGLIVVDEEHDASFKQDEGVAYNGRDMAVVRARLGGFPVVLASATPSLETVANVQAGRYGHLVLPGRHGGAVLPGIALVDLRRDPPERQHWISPPLRAAVEETIAAGEQAMLFLNRRGYAPLTLCSACGHRLECPNCSAWLVEHRQVNRLQCHHCGYSARRPDNCPSCGEEDSFRACGPGVERLAEEAEAVFPQARMAVMTSDTVTSPRAAAELVRAMEERRIDLLIGTQIVAKGYHFPYLTLVGVVDADLGLAGGDLRAGERTYQLLSQVAGRAGRAERPGRVILQSYMPEHPVLGALLSGDRDGFVMREQAARREAGMPPYGRLAALIVSGTRLDSVAAAARELGRKAPRGDGITVLGPAPAPMALLRGRHRYRLLLKARRDIERQGGVQGLVSRWLAAAEIPGNVRVQIDIDPYSFF